MKKIEHTFVDGIEGKVCPKCGEWKALEMFSIARRAPSGLSSWCRACGNTAGAKRYATSPEKAYARHVKWAKNHPEQTRASDARWKKGHLEQVRTYSTKRRQANRAKALELLGHSCSAPGCSQDLHGIAWGAHHKTPRAITGREHIAWVWSWPRIKRELLNDVELLCAPCHRAADHVGLIKAAREAGTAHEKLTRALIDEAFDRGAPA